MSVTHTPLCTVKGCPAPNNPDWHQPWCRDIPGHECFGDATHQHWPKRSRGGKRIVACLCAGAHDIVDNGYKWGNGVFPDKDGKEVYLLWDVAKGIEHPLIERELGDGDEQRPRSARDCDGFGDAAATVVDSADGDGGDVSRNQGDVGDAVPVVDSAAAEAGEPGVTISPARNQDRAEGHSAPSASAVAPSASGVSAGAEAVRLAEPDGYVLTAKAQGNAPGEKRRGSSAPALTHERCMALTAEIRDMQRNRQWRAGDLGNLFIKVLGEQAEQYICDFGFAEPTIANILKVCEAITPEERHDDVSFGHCAVYYKKNREDRDMWRDVVLAERVTVRELREKVHGVKAKVKRWTADELRERWDGFWTVRDQENPEWDFGTFRHAAFAKFLDWLSAEEAM